MILVRQEIGEVLRDFRLQKGRTLRQVAGRASVALGYLSEVERGAALPGLYPPNEEAKARYAAWKKQQGL